jgi:hypothetical protein
MALLLQAALQRLRLQACSPPQPNPPRRRRRRHSIMCTGCRRRRVTDAICQAWDPQGLAELLELEGGGGHACTIDKSCAGLVNAANATRRTQVFGSGAPEAGRGRRRRRRRTAGCAAACRRSRRGRWRLSPKP